MRIYTARPRWNDGRWTSTVDEVTGLVATARLLEQVPTAVTSGLVNFPGAAMDDSEEALVLVLPEVDAESVGHLRDFTEQARRPGRQAQEGIREAVLELCAKGLTFRDIGTILTIDFTYAQQLAHEPQRP